MSIGLEDSVTALRLSGTESRANCKEAELVLGHGPRRKNGCPQSGGVVPCVDRRVHPEGDRVRCSDAELFV